LLKEADIIYRLLAGKPIFAGYNVTNRCTMRCAFCSVPSLPHEDMDLAAARHAFDILKGIGVPVIGITGGEPFLRKDLAELIYSVQERGMLCTVVTNGDLFDRTRAAELAGVRNIVHFALSMDTLDASVYKSLRGKSTLPATLARYLDAIEHGPSCPYKLNVVLGPENVDEVDDILLFASTAGLYVSFIPINIAPGGLHRGRTYDTLTPEARQRLAAAFLRLHRLKTGGAPLWDHRGFYLLAADYIAGRKLPDCRAGQLFLDLRSDGKLAFCNEMEHFVDLTRVESLSLGQLRRSREAWAPRIDACRTASACCYTCSYNVVATAANLPAYVFDFLRLKLSLPGQKAGARARP
jgi:MoaA/NifB/PqqE/SkfB family radical SAM enzyme